MLLPRPSHTGQRCQSWCFAWLALWACAGAVTAGAQAQSVMPTSYRGDWRIVVGAILSSPVLQTDDGRHRLALRSVSLGQAEGGNKQGGHRPSGSWAAFEEQGDMVVAEAGLLVSASDIAAVMRRLAEGGIEAVSMRLHLTRQAEVSACLHVAGEGDAGVLAEAIRNALAEALWRVEHTGHVPSAMLPPSFLEHDRSGEGCP